MLKLYLQHRKIRTKIFHRIYIYYKNIYEIQGIGVQQFIEYQRNSYVGTKFYGFVFSFPYRYFLGIQIERNIFHI